VKKPIDLFPSLFVHTYMYMFVHIYIYISIHMKTDSGIPRVRGRVERRVSE